MVIHGCVEQLGLFIVTSDGSSDALIQERTSISFSFMFEALQRPMVFFVVAVVLALMIDGTSIADLHRSNSMK